MVIRKLLAGLGSALLLSSAAHAQVNSTTPGPQPAPASSACATSPCPPANGGSGVANTGNLTWTGALTFTNTTGQSFALPPASDTLAGLTTAQIFTKANTFSVAGAASTSGLSITGAPFTGGSGTTTTPQIYANSGTAPTTFSTAGTILGGNGPSGFAGNFLDYHANGGVSLFSVGSGGAISTVSSITSTNSNVIVPAAQNFVFASRTVLGAPANGSFSINTNSLSATSVLSVPASNTLQFGNFDAAVAVAQTLRAQSVVAGTSNVGGQNWTDIASLSTGSGVSGDRIFQTGGTGAAATVQNTATTALIIKGGTQAIQMPALASSSSAQTGTVCWTTGTGNLTVDTTTTCLLSDMRLKKNMVSLSDNEGLTEVMALKPFSYDLKDDPLHVGRQVGLGAQQVAKVDPRLVAIYDRGPNIGTPKGVRYEQLTAVLVKAVQQEQAEIEGLRREIRQLDRRK